MLLSLVSFGNFRQTWIFESSWVWIFTRNNDITKCGKIFPALLETWISLQNFGLLWIARHVKCDLILPKTMTHLFIFLISHSVSCFSFKMAKKRAQSKFCGILDSRLLIMPFGMHRSMDRLLVETFLSLLLLQKASVLMIIVCFCPEFCLFFTEIVIFFILFYFFVVRFCW